MKILKNCRKVNKGRNFRYANLLAYKLINKDKYINKNIYKHMNQLTRVFASSPKRDKFVKKFLKTSAKASLLGFFAIALAIGGYFNFPPAPPAQAALQAVGPISPLMDFRFGIRIPLV